MLQISPGQRRVPSACNHINGKYSGVILIVRAEKPSDGLLNQEKNKYLTVYW